MNKKYNKTKAIVIGLGVLGIIWFIRNYATKTNDQISRLALAAPTLPVPRAAANVLPAGAQIVFVPRTVDGDTIMVESVDSATGAPTDKPQSLRYIGMDTPETVSPTKPVECYGHEASDRNRALVAGKYVAIVRDESDRDKYGRLLRFVYLLDGTIVNLELVREGYARVLTIPPNIEFASQLQAAASSAQAMRLGFWGACTSYPFKS